MHNRTKKSIIQQILRTAGIALAGIIAILFIYVLISVIGIRREILQIADSYLYSSGTSVDHKIENLEWLGKDLLYNNDKYVILQSGSESERYYALRDIRRQLMDRTAFVDEIDFVAVMEGKYGQKVYTDRRGLSESVREQLLQLVKTACVEGVKKPGWQFVRVGQKVFLYRIYEWQNCATGIFSSTDTIFKDIAASLPQNLRLTVSDQKGETILDMPSSEPAVSKWNSASAMFPASSYKVTDNAMQLSVQVQAGRGFTRQSGTIMLLMLILAVTIEALLLRRQIRVHVQQPMQIIQKNMNRIRQGDLDIRIMEDFNSTEYDQLKETFNHLMDEITNLKIESYEKQIELSENELRSVRLQLRPHFFLNALTTISSLSMKQRNEEIQTYIDALSKNVRYMFRSGLHTVPLADELRHVENYFAMQELKYPGCVFYFIEQEQGTQNWPIPQMILHTIIENEYKYAVSVDQPLSILIHAGLIQINDKMVLEIVVEDDGKGYPEQFLSDFASSKAGIRVNGERVGLYSIRRMLELMYEKEDLFEISNISPHGCRNRILIPEKPVHEIRADLEN